MNRGNFLKKAGGALSFPAIDPLLKSSKGNIKKLETQTGENKVKHKKAYLKVEDWGEGMFSIERILKAVDYNGNLMSGFFDNSNIKNGRLEITVIGEERDCVAIVTPQYFLGQSNIILVKKSDLKYFA